MIISTPPTSDTHADNGIEFSILTVHYKSNKYRASLLESLRKYTENYEYLEHNNELQNLGYAKATNKLIRETKGKYIILLKQDSRVKHGWADALSKNADSTKKIGMVVRQHI